MKTSNFILKDFILKVLFLFFFFNLIARQHASAQISNDLNNVKVEELTDGQIRNFVLQADRIGLKDDQIEQSALQRGINPDELVKLKNRIQAFRKVLNNSNYQSSQNKINSNSPQPDSSISNLEQRPLENYGTLFSELKTKNFGFEVFNNNRITFEPNLRLPTPVNYKLAADDELLIDVSGLSEASYKLKVTPEGIIKIPNAGTLAVNGLTIEQARRLITNRLASTIYTNIKIGKTKVDINLGTIRSIKVTIIGEATLPGTYTLPSLASAYNALYACGGPNFNGSFRNIQIIRNSKIVSTIDVYQYLLTGSKKSDIRLMDDDVIKINPYTVRIELKGEVKKPGLYDVAKGETLAQIVKYANGFTDNAYTDKIQVYKNTSRERKVTTITENDLSKVIPQRGDTYIVGKILNRFANRINITGAVYRPGEYELKDGMTLSQLIDQADGLREDAFTARATLHRLKDDLSPEIISFDVTRLLKGDTNDIKLKREDRVNIFSKFDLKEGYYVTIEGEVSSPGYYLYEEGVTVQDLILMAGGLKEAASVKHIEVSRRIKKSSNDTTTNGNDATNVKTAIIIQTDITPDMKDSSSYASLVLQPFDEITIHPAPGYYVQKNAVIEGEVVFGGKYTLEAKSDRISDLIKRSGGLTSEAYLPGAVLVRSKNLSKTEQSNNQQGIFNLLKQNIEAGGTTELLQQQLLFSSQKKSENVDIDLQKILAHPQSQYDLLLNDGDTLRIPKQLQTVRVNGEVLYPSLVRYDDEYNFKDYISRAGGFSERSSRKRPYVVYANGSVKGTHSFLFFRRYPTLKPGAEIFVPVKRERERLRTGEIVTVGATVVTMLAVIFNFLRR